MHRRRLLAATGAALATTIAGCIGGQPDGGTTPDGPPTSFSIVDAGCGNQVSDARVTAGDDPVTVEGTIWGNDACHVARLDGVRHEGDTLTVEVVTESAAEPGQACAQCITEIDYRATVDVARPPGTVVVVHDCEAVLEAAP